VEGFPNIPEGFPSGMEGKPNFPEGNPSPPEGNPNGCFREDLIFSVGYARCAAGIVFAIPPGNQAKPICESLAPPWPFGETTGSIQSLHEAHVSRHFDFQQEIAIDRNCYRRNSFAAIIASAAFSLSKLDHSLSSNKKLGR
jgi:hypothetical protein